MIKTTSCFHDDDILIMDRGFISRDVINYPKNKRNVDVYIPDYWISSNKDEDVDLNACIVWFRDTQKYAVSVTTDISKTGKEIISIYQLRPKIEEDFKSTKLNVISFHIICVLYISENFCVMSLGEFIELRDICSEDIKEYLLEFIK